MVPSLNLACRSGYESEDEKGLSDWTLATLGGAQFP